MRYQILMLVFLAGCSASQATNYAGKRKAVAIDYTPAAVASIAIAEAVISPVAPVVVKVKRSQCAVCKGTGKVKAGDGVIETWRECDNCEPDGPGEM